MLLIGKMIFPKQSDYIFWVFFSFVLIINSASEDPFNQQNQLIGVICEFKKKSDHSLFIIIH